jgi:DNA polymerase III epsilon subunit-like protein
MEGCLVPKIVLLDIETSPSVAYVWRFFKENVSPKQVLEHPHIMSFAAKELGKDGIIYHENRKSDDKKIITELVHLLDETDFVIAHYGDGFDLPMIRGRALVNQITPPSPVKVIDTLRIAKKQFKFPSYSLEYLSKALDLKTKKGSHKKFAGFELWLECLRGNEEAWAEMKEYNIKDILSLEELYYRLRPWDTTHPNLSIYEAGETMLCPKCGSGNVHRRGFAYTNTGKYPRFQCVSCGGWGKGRYTELAKNDKIIVNQVR